MFQCIIHIVALFILFLGNLLHEILGQSIRQYWKTLVLEFELEFIGLHSRIVKGMSALIVHHKHDHGTGP